MASMREPIVLASASPTRARLLKDAGVPFTIQPPDIDESPLKQQAREAGRAAIECALDLAHAKAAAVSMRHPEALVIGADQLLTAGDEWFDKPADTAAARAQLQRLRGRTHVLATAVCVCHAGERLWHAESMPELTMRDFSDAFLDDYLATARDTVLGSVGAYRLESRGIQLFSRMTGDHFAVLGLPLTELFEFLRSRGALLS
jgi:nucleoside triphosphate pyrophosphatase